MDYMERAIKYHAQKRRDKAAVNLMEYIYLDIVLLSAMIAVFTM